MLQALEEGIILVKHGKITFANRQFCKLLGQLKVNQARFLYEICFELKYETSSVIPAQQSSLRSLISDRQEDVRDNVYTLQCEPRFI